MKLHNRVCEHRFQSECQECGKLKAHPTRRAAEIYSEHHYHNAQVVVCDRMARSGRPRRWAWNSTPQYWSVKEWRK